MEPLIHDFSIDFPKVGTIHYKIGYSELEDFYKRLEPQTKKYYSDTIQNNWNVIDVGANIGMFTLLFSKLTNNKVFGIEASKHNFAMLEKNCEGYKNIILNNLYISNKTEIEEGEIHYLWTGRGSVLREKSEFPFIKLDDIQILQNTKIDLIKIDIDGYDFEAIQGATEIMKNHKPIVVIELVDEALQLHGFNKKMVIDFMYQNNYHHTITLDNCNYVFESN